MGKEENFGKQKFFRLMFISLITAISCILLFLQINFALYNRQINEDLPVSCTSQPLPETSVTIEVNREGAATLNGESVEGLSWPIEDFNWFAKTPYWERIFVPENKLRTKSGQSGHIVPITLRLNKDIEFSLPQFFWLMNIWIETIGGDDSRPEGLSFCFTDPDTCQPDRNGDILIYWHGKHYPVSINKGCFPVYLLPGGRYKIPEYFENTWVALLTSRAHSQYYRIHPVRLKNYPEKPFTATEFAKMLEYVGPGCLICVKLEKGVSVQEVVDFMTLCEDLKQPWTFYFESW